MTKPLNKIEKLIAELCPEGVDVKELGEIAQYSRQRIAAADLHNENYVGVDNLLPNKQGKTKSNYVPTTGKLTRFESGDVLLGNIRPYLKKIWRATHTGGTNGDVLAIQINNKERLQSEFLYYLLSSDDFFNFDMKFAKGAKMPRGNKSAILKFHIPIPPLAIQQEIVKILDTFTALEAELEAELEARKKQYEYYRDELLTFGEDVEWKTLGGVAANLDSKRKPVTKRNRKKGEYPYYGASGIVDYVSDYIFDGDYLLVSEDGANLLARVTPIAFSASGKIWVNNHAHVLEFETYAEKKFIEYYLNMIDLSRFISTAAQPKLTQDNLNKIPIPILSLTEQNRIVAILDKFDALVNGTTPGPVGATPPEERNLSASLPAELNARRKQYEYYRDKLLTFKELNSPPPEGCQSKTDGVVDGLYE